MHTMTVLPLLSPFVCAGTMRCVCVCHHGMHDGIPIFVPLCLCRHGACVCAHIGGRCRLFACVHVPAITTTRMKTRLCACEWCMCVIMHASAYAHVLWCFFCVCVRFSTQALKYASIMMRACFCMCLCACLYVSVHVLRVCSEPALSPLSTPLRKRLWPALQAYAVHPAWAEVPHVKIQ